MSDFGYDDNILVVVDNNDDSPYAYTQSRNSPLSAEWN